MAETAVAILVLAGVLAWTSRRVPASPRQTVHVHVHVAAEAEGGDGHYSSVIAHEEHIEQVTSAPATANADPERVIVTFVHRDGTVEQRRLFRHSLLEQLPWRNGVFRKQGDEQPVVYREI